MKKNIIFLLLAYLCISCNDRSQNIKFQLKNIKTNNIQLTGIPLYNDSIIWNSQIVGFVDNKLIIECQNCDSVYSVYSFSKDSLFKDGQIVKKGQGPYEMIYPNIMVDNSLKYIYLYDTGKNFIFYKIDINLFHEVYNPNNWTQISFPKMKGSYFWKSFVCVNDSTLIGLGGSIEKENLLSLIQLNENKIIDLNIDFPKDESLAGLITKRLVYNDGNILKRPDNNQYLYYCSEGNYAEIITFNTDMKVKNRKKILDNPPTYEELPDGVNFKYIRDGLNGLKAYITDKYIYILPFSFQEPGEDNYKGYPKGYSDILYVFDWDSNFIKSYKFNKPIATFVVEKNDLFVIATTINIQSDELYCELFHLE